MRLACDSKNCALNDEQARVQQLLHCRKINRSILRPGMVTMQAKGSNCEQNQKQNFPGTQGDAFSVSQLRCRRGPQRMLQKTATCHPAKYLIWKDKKVDVRAVEGIQAAMGLFAIPGGTRSRDPEFCSYDSQSFELCTLLLKNSYAYPANPGLFHCCSSTLRNQLVRVRASFSRIAFLLGNCSADHNCLGSRGGRIRTMERGATVSSGRQVASSA